MILDRLETLAAIEFAAAAIPKDEKTGKNCLFCRVEDGKLICIGGGEYVVKRAILIRSETTEEAARPRKENKLPDNFMIPIADLMAFKELMKGHKADCKRLAKNDQSYLYVEITDKEMISHDGKVVYEQPKFQYKEMESLFIIERGPVLEISAMSSDVSAAISGFNKSEKIDVVFSGEGGPIHFSQGDFESILIPPVEKADDGNEQTFIEDEKE